MASKIIGIIEGVAVKYGGNGRKLGYPTANIKQNTPLKEGIYLAHCSLDGFRDHPSLVFIGKPKTLGGEDFRVEAHLLDIPDKDYYGQSLRIELLHYVRPNQTFKLKEELVTKMKQDEAYARKWFKGK